MKFNKIFTFFIIFFLNFGIFSTIFAQTGNIGLPSTHVVFDVVGDGVKSGDIVSYNKELNIYEQSSVAEDSKVFGVVNTNPILVFRTGNNGFPILQAGEVRVNVSNLNGDIKSGDDITTSDIPGVGQKFIGSNGYILGTALEPLNGETSDGTVIFDGKEINTGSILVLLSIGPAVNDLTKPVAPATIFVQEGGEERSGLESLLRYVVAILFTLGTLFIVIRTFGPNLKKGVVSIGRNPLAKTSIQAMVVFNVILILSISIISFIVSLLIIFLPL